MIDYIEGHPDVFPPDKMNDYLAFVEPEQLPEITDLLHKNGHSEQVIAGILGGNFLRIAKQVWK